MEQYSYNHLQEHVPSEGNLYLNIILRHENLRSILRYSDSVDTLTGK